MSRLSKLLLALLPACSTASQIYYQHDPTADLHKTWTLSDPALTPFTASGVVVSPRLIPLNYDETAVKLLFGAHAATSFTVQRATLTGAGGSRELEVDQTASVGTAAPVAGVYKGEMTLVTLPNTELEALAGGGALQLTVALPADAAGAPGAALHFEIARRTRTYLNTR